MRRVARKDNEFGRDFNRKNSAYENFKKALGGVSGIYNGEQFILTHAKGHLYQFEEPYKQVDASLSGKYKSWNIDFLPWDEKEFKWRRIKKPGSDALLKEIYNVLSKCDEIVIATDDDPSGEGELLAWEILSELKLRPRKYSRMYFPDEAAGNIQKAFVSRKEIPSMDKDMDYIKALYRTKWDFISIQFTRIATIFGDGRSVLRQGRLKSAMVWLVGEQLKAVSEYKKRHFIRRGLKMKMVMCIPITPKKNIKTNLMFLVNISLPALLLIQKRLNHSHPGSCWILQHYLQYYLPRE